MRSLPKWKMQGAVREKSDLIHTSKYRAGEKGSGSKTREGTAMQLETAMVPVNGRDKGWWVTVMRRCQTTHRLGHVLFAWQSQHSNLRSKLILRYDENLDTGIYPGWLNHLGKNDGNLTSQSRKFDLSNESVIMLIQFDEWPSFSLSVGLLYTDGPL